MKSRFGLVPEAATFGDLLRWRATHQPDDLAYTFLDNGEDLASHLTYRELDLRARRIAALLRQECEPGDRALLLYPASLEYIAAFFGCLYAGVIAVPAYQPRMTRLNRSYVRLEAIARDARPSVALTPTNLSANSTHRLTQEVAFRDIKWIATAALSDDAPPDPEPLPVDDQTLAFLQYTSGTTGTAKGVMVSHVNLMHNQRLMRQAFQLDEASTIVGWLPMFHDMGLVGNMLHPIYVGARCVLMSPISFLQRPLRWLKAISTYQATTSGGPNFAYDLCVRKITDAERETLDLSSWQVAFNGAEPIRSQTLERFSATFESCGFKRTAFYPCYGLAEASLIVSGGAKQAEPVMRSFSAGALEKGEAVADDEEARPLRTLVGCGQTLADQQIAVVDTETLNPCAPGVVGEIWVCGGSVAQGYWNRPEESEQTFRARLADDAAVSFLRTGDLGFEHEGELFIVGRLKDLIIIRGRNHHPQDIEMTVEQSHPSLRPSCGAAFSIDVEGEERLVIVQEVTRSHRALDVEEVTSAVRQAVAQEHEISVHAIVLIRHGTIPKTSSGKLQRHACKIRFLTNALEVVGSSILEEASTNEESEPFIDRETLLTLSTRERQDSLIAALRAHAARALGVPPAKVESHRALTALGLDSLMAVDLKNRIEVELGVEIEVTSLLEGASVADIAALVSERIEGAACPAPAIAPIDRDVSTHPVSHGQRSLWFLHQLAPHSTAYHIARAIKIDDALDAEALSRALDKLVMRHAALRTTFMFQGSEPVQHVSEQMAPGWQEEDVSAWSDARIRERLTEEAHRPFDLERGPLLRLHLFRKSASEQILLLTLHHIIADLWSLAVIFRELGLLYAAEVAGREASLAPPALCYTDYVHWQQRMLRDERSERLESYWMEQLSGELPALNLPTDRPRPATQGFNGSSLRFRLDAGLTRGLRQLCAEHGATLYVGLLAAFQVLLHHYTKQEEVIVGSPVTERNLPELGDLVGYFVNPVPLRTRFSGRPSFTELLRAVQRTVRGALQHHDYPFDLIVERLQPEREANRSPIFQAMLVMQRTLFKADELAVLALNVDGAPLELGGLSCRSIALETRAVQFDLTLIVAEIEDGLGAALEYNTDLFDVATVERLISHFQTLLAGIVARPQQSIADLPLLSAPERREILADWNATEVDYPRDLPLHRLIEQQVVKTPNATAVEFGQERLTYGELNERADALAKHLRWLGVRPDEVVGICVERSTEMMVGLLGILKAGGAYLPLDPAHPIERLSFMLEDAAARVLLTHAPTAALLSAPQAIEVNLSEWRPTSGDAGDDDERPETCGADNLAYVIYTSGSTGRPKGVMIPHSGITNRLLWMQDAYQLTPHDAVLQKTPLTFDVSVWELFWPLMAGARLVVAPPQAHTDPERLSQLIREHEVSVVHFVPSMLRMFLEAEDAAKNESLRLVVCSGEALSATLQERFFERFDADLENLYGPTEASVDVTFWRCEKEHAASPGVPIGRPIANTQIYLLDERLNPVPPGVPGELYIAGRGLARGYLKRAELTAETFIPNPFGDAPGARLYRTGDLARYRPDGVIEFLGRIDHQVKIRGNRIELGEVESVLRQHADVSDVAVVTYESSAHDRQLIAYVVWDAQARPLPVRLREFALKRLPPYMVPSFFIALESLPLTPSGKLDRKALPPPNVVRPASESEYVPPFTTEQEILTSIWAQVLGLDSVGIDDNFFSIGGDSIRSIEVVAGARQAGLSISIDKIFQYQTVRLLTQHCAEELEGSHAAQTPESFALISEQDRAQLPEELEDAYPMSFLQQGLVFHSEYGADYEVYVTRVHVRARFDREAFAEALRYVVARHPILRTSFSMDAYSEPLQLVHASASIPLEVFDVRQLTTNEQASVVLGWVAQEKKKKFDWSSPPFARISIHRSTDETFHVTLSDPLFDGWSVASFLSELLRTYGALLEAGAIPAAPPLAASFRDFVALEREALASEACQQYWDSTLSECAPNKLPRWPLSNEAGTVEGIHRVQRVVPTEVSKGLRLLAHAAAVPVKSVLLAAHVKVMSCLLGHQDVLTGLISNGRAERADGDKVLGTHLNALPFRVRLSTQTWSELAQQVFDVERSLLPYRRYPIAELQRRHGRQSFFESVLNFTHFHAYQRIAEFAGMEILEGDASEQTYFPLTIQFNIDHLTADITLALDYTASEFPREQIEAYADYYLRALAAMSAQPSEPHVDFSPLSAAERRQLLFEWNDTAAAYELEQSVAELIEAQAERQPEADALVCGEQRLSYREMNRRANQVAHFLRRMGSGVEGRVGICMSRSAEMVVSLLGVLKAGAAYVPLDPAYPSERLAGMIEDAQLSVLLTERQHAERLSQPSGGKLVCIDDDRELIARESDSNPGIRVLPDNLAYLIFTSGSTGRAKGVGVPYRGLLNLVNWHRQVYELSPSDRTTQLAGTGFDASVWEIWPTLISGASLYLPDEMTRLSPEDLQRWLVEERITISFIPTPLAEACLALPWPEQTPLRYMLTGGDKLHRYPSQPTDFTLVNHYGPTENTVVASAVAVPVRPDSTEAPPIGRPISNTQIYLLDKQLQPVPSGVPGELYIGGQSLARGYFNRPDLTAEKFIPDPFGGSPGARLYGTGDLASYLPDGNIIFIGRTDEQVKVRGFRIELGDVEAALRAHTALRDAMVIASPDSLGETRLVAYIVPEGANAPTAGELREMLKLKLPDYMIPSAFVVLEFLPLTPSGKIDRRALPSPDIAMLAEERAYVAPRDEVEAQLAQVWEKVLQRHPIGVNDNFFELGGHSLLATQVVSRTRMEFEVELPLSALFESPTVAGMAEVVKSLQDVSEDEEELAGLLDELEKLSDEEIRDRLYS
jgi:amino acid adenylation domain-containing protein